MSAMLSPELRTELIGKVCERLFKYPVDVVGGALSDHLKALEIFDYAAEAQSIVNQATTKANPVAEVAVATATNTDADLKARTFAEANKTPARTVSAEPKYLEPFDTLGYLRLLFEPGDWIDVKIIHQTKTWTDVFGKTHAETQDSFMALEDADAAMLRSIPERQNEGWNIYVGMNAFTPGLRRRREKDVKTIRSVYVEFDENTQAGLDKIAADTEAELIPQYDFVLHSSNGKAYVIWLVTGFDVPTQKAINKALQTRYGSDPQSVDAARVLRLPGTRNLKYDPNPIVEILDEAAPHDRKLPEDFKIEYVVPKAVDRAAAPEKVQIRMACYEEACDNAGVDAGDLIAKDDASYSYIVECPNWEEHTNKSKFDGSVWISPSGHISYRCWHQHCSDKDWSNFYRPWLEEQAKENGFEGFLKFGEASEIEQTSGELAMRQPKTESPVNAVKLVSSLLFLSPKQRAALNLPTNREEALNMVDRAVYGDLQNRGRFYNVGGLGYFIETGREDKPVKISQTDPVCQNLLEGFGLHAGRTAKDGVGKFLGVRSFIDGEHVSQHISFHFDLKTRTAYYAEGLGTLLKVTKDGIGRIKNGEDGVLFIYPENYEPWTFTPVAGIEHSLIPANGSALYDAVLKGLTFEDSVMTDEQKCVLLTVYLILLFLPGLNKSKILLQMLGPSGSGKSFFLEMIGRLVLGPRFSTQPMPPDPKEFENQVINSSFIAYDNVNRIERAVKDLLCQVATGLTVNRRELFTTAGQVSFPALATVAFSAITSPLNEVEHANRSLVIQMKKRPSGMFRSAVDLMQELDGQRDRLMSELVERVRMVLVALDGQRNYRPNTNVRLADVGTFLLRVSRHEGWEPKAKEILTAWVGEQAASAMEDDDIGQVMVEILRNPDFKPTWLSSGEFKSLLVSTGNLKRVSMDGWSTRSPKTLATILVRNMESYTARFGLEQDFDRHTKNRTFRLNPSASLLADIRKAATTVAGLIEKPSNMATFQ
jgi:hypothetical protein